jgi:hypothetical protein
MAMGKVDGNKRRSEFSAVKNIANVNKQHFFHATQK